MFKAVFKVGVPRFSEAGQYCFDLTGGSGNYSLELFSGAEDFYSLEAFTRSQTCEVQELIADVLNANDYYPFGMQMPGRSFNGGDYRYGFNGMEKDDELKGEGSSLDFGARIYDPRIGRWLSLDPEAREYPQYSDYSFVFNSPLSFIDPTGKIVVPADNLSTEKRERVEAALTLVSEKMPELFNYLNTLKYHSGTQKFLSPGDEGYDDDEAFDVIIAVGVENLDGEERKKEMRAQPSGTTFIFKDPAKHTDGETVNGDGAHYAGVREEEDGSYSVVDKDKYEWVNLKSLDQTKGLNSSVRWKLDEGEVHFKVSLDDFIGSSDADGSVLSHEFGHVEGKIKNALNDFFFSAIYKGEDKGGHEPGNISGEVAEQRTKEYDEAD